MLRYWKKLNEYKQILYMSLQFLKIFYNGSKNSQTQFDLPELCQNSKVHHFMKNSYFLSQKNGLGHMLCCY